MRKGYCKHYTNEKLFTHCRAGVRYRDVSRRDFSLPAGEMSCCDEKSTCEKLELPTDKELAENRAKRREDVKEVLKLFPFLARIKAVRDGNWRGTEPCPICGNALEIEYFSTTGRTWGRCETRDCISWVE